MVHYDPFMEEILDDPFPLYKRLRDEAPAYFVEKHDCWALSRFEDVWNVSQNAKTFQSGEGPGSSLFLADLPEAVRTEWDERPPTASIFTMNPPDHVRLRKALAPQFTKRSTAKLEAFIRENVRENLAAALPTGKCDVLTDVGLKLSVQVTCKIIGLPVEDGELLAGITRRYFSREPGTHGMPESAIAAAMELDEYLLRAVAARRRSGVNNGDILDAFMAFEQDGRRYSDTEIASHYVTLVVGGTETLPKVAAGGLLQLYRRPEQRARLIAEPSLIPDAFEEILRYEMPTQFLTRIVARDVELHGEKLREGQGVMLLYRAANRDEREFPDPETFDIARKPRRILTFGHGHHVCMGQHVARLEGRVLLEEVLASMPDYVVREEDIVPARSEFVAGYIEMPIEFKPS